MSGKKKPKTKALALYSKFRKTDEEWRTGRPKIEINQTAFEELCKNQTPLKSICIILRCSDDTINRWCKATYNETFAATYKIFSAYRKSELASTLFDVAMGKRLKTFVHKEYGPIPYEADPDSGLLKFLGKNFLGLSDNGPKDTAQTTINNTNNSGAPVNINQDIKIEVEYVKKKEVDPDKVYEKPDFDKRFDDEFENETDDSLLSETDEDSDAVVGEVVE